MSFEEKILDGDELESAAEAREQEIEALCSIFEDSIERETSQDGSVQLRISLPTSINGTTRLHVWLPQGCRYPAAPPTVALYNTTLPSYIRMAAHTALHELCVQNVGEPCIFQLIDWVRDSLPDLVKSPPSLVSLRAKQSPYIGLNLQNGDVGQCKSRRGGGSGRLHGGVRPGGRDGNLSDDPSVSAQLLLAMERAAENAEFRKMQVIRQKLPSFSFRDIIISTVATNQVTIVCGETGCGKTTQVPQFILEDAISRKQGAKCNIVCTQPRRLSATAVAQRVSVERAETIGDVVGYSVRLDSKRSARTRLLFCTTGILLRQLHHDPQLSSITHILVDEVHERSVDSDVLLAVLRLLMRSRRDLKLVLMSATLDSAKFLKYFNGAPVLEIPGFTHPVKDYYLENVLAMIRTRRPLHDDRLQDVPSTTGAVSRAGRQGQTSTATAAATAAALWLPSTTASQSVVDDWEQTRCDSETSDDPEADEAEATALELVKAEAAAAAAEAGDEVLATAAVPVSAKILVPALELAMQQGVLNKTVYTIQYELIAQLVAHICHTDDNGGAVLVFLPGIAEIKKFGTYTSVVFKFLVCEMSATEVVV
jgi:hypothetical protein